MSRISSVSVVLAGAYRDSVSVVGQRHALTRLVVRRLALNIAAKLRPRTTEVLKHAHVSGSVAATSVVLDCSDGEDGSIG